MPDLAQLQALICEMYLQTSQGAHTRHHADLSVSFERVRKAHCKKRSASEQARLMQGIYRGIKQDLLNGPASREILVEGLKQWEGVKVR